MATAAREQSWCRIGTRQSQLARIQAAAVQDALLHAHGGAANIAIHAMRSSGDWRPEQGEVRLSEAEGGKGLFVREIERALLDGEVDCGAHSLKDLPSGIPEGLEVAYMLPAGDPRDAFLSSRYDSLEAMPEGGVIGTSSLRRQSLLLHQRPDLHVTTLRGNVNTRIEKMQAGQVDAAILSLAGLERLDLSDHVTCVLNTDTILPACGQGVICIELREGDTGMHDLFAPVHCYATGLRCAAERAALRVLGGTCHTPIGAHATPCADDQLRLRLAVAYPDGSRRYDMDETAPARDEQDAIALGETTGRRMIEYMPSDILT